MKWVAQTVRKVYADGNDIRKKGSNNNGKNKTGYAGAFFA